jgi:arginine:ornithine antiporter/lysine permease
MLELTSSMTLIPYLLVAGYGLLVARRGEGYSPGSTLRTRDAVIAAIAVIYTAFMIFAGGLKYLLLSSVLYAPGTLLYYWTRREQGERNFQPVEWIIFLVAVVGCVAGIWGIATGRIAV